MTRRSLLFLSPLVLATSLATDALAAQRVFVRSNGVDSGTCTLAAPCRGFTYAMTQVDPGGEVVALDAAGYGAVAVTKSVTITANPGFFAGISASTGSAISVNGSGIAVVLRGLNLNGLGATTGIDLVQGSSLTIENTVVSGFGCAGIQVIANADVRILDTVVRNNGAAEDCAGIVIGGGAFATLNNVLASGNVVGGLLVADAGDFTTRAIVTDSEASGNGNGFIAATFSTGFALLSVNGSTASMNVSDGFVSSGAGANIAVGYSSAVGNGSVGFNHGGGTFESYGNNLLRYNTTATNGTITPATGQ